MPTEVTVLWTYLRARCRASGDWNDAGTVVEKVILTAIFAALAIRRGHHHRRQGDRQGQLDQSQLRTARMDGTGATPSRRSRTDAGSSIVEAVIIIPVVMILLLLGVQFALWMHAAQVVQLAASEGDRSARSMGGGAAAGLATAQAVVDGPGSDVSSPAISVAMLAGDAELLRVSGHTTSVIPGLSFSVSASAIGPVQEFRGSE